MLGHLVYTRAVYDAWETRGAVKPPAFKIWLLRTAKAILRRS